jgi:nucleoside-diphosphate-sugar epimerase
MAAGHSVTGLVRSQAKADALGMPSVIGTLEDRDVLSEAALQADAVVNAANASHRGVVEIFLEAMSGSGKTFVQTSGSSIVGDMARGEARDAVYDEGSKITPLPGRADRVIIDDMVLAAGNDELRTAIVCPTLIYGEGLGLNKHSMQVPWLFALAEKHGGVPRHIGSGGNIWSNVHITDLVELYRLVLEGAPTGSFYFAENGEASMRELCEAISRTLDQGGRTESMSLEEGIAEWGDGAANYTMGSNSRVRGKRARSELGWLPSGPSVLEEIEHGCYAR